MWIVIYLLIGIIYCYLLDTPLYNSIINSDRDMYLFLLYIIE